MLSETKEKNSSKKLQEKSETAEVLLPIGFYTMEKMQKRKDKSLG